MHCIRAKDKPNHLFVHLNLCIALAMGLVVFIAGIENATTNKVGVCNNFIAGIFMYVELLRLPASLYQHSCNIYLYLLFVGCCVKE